MGLAAGIPVDCRRLPAVGLGFLQLQTPRLVMRPMVEADVDSMANQPAEVAADGMVTAVPGRNEIELMRRGFAREWQAHGIGHLLIFEADSRFLAGHLSLKPFQRPSGGRGAEIAYAIDAPFRGQGYAGEAVAAGLLLAFEIEGLDYVLACVEPDNLASLRVVRRVGFVAIGEGKIRGRLLRRFLMGRAAWKAAPAATVVNRDA
jgi:RimJ/RimL family protein N-acetyltransferase